METGLGLGMIQRSVIALVSAVIILNGAISARGGDEVTVREVTDPREKAELLGLREKAVRQSSSDRHHGIRLVSRSGYGRYHFPVLGHIKPPWDPHAPGD